MVMNIIKNSNEIIIIIINHNNNNNNNNNKQKEGSLLESGFTSSCQKVHTEATSGSGMALFLKV